MSGTPEQPAGPGSLHWLGSSGEEVNLPSSIPFEMRQTLVDAFGPESPEVYRWDHPDTHSRYQPALRAAAWWDRAAERWVMYPLRTATGELLTVDHPYNRDRILCNTVRRLWSYVLWRIFSWRLVSLIPLVFDGGATARDEGPEREPKRQQT